MQTCAFTQRSLTVTASAPLLTAGGIGEWVHALAMGLEESDFFYRKIHGLVDFLKGVGDYLEPGFNKAVEAVKSWGGSAKEYATKAANDIRPAMSDIKTKLVEFSSSLK